MTLETAVFLINIVSNLTLSVGEDNFAQVAASVVQAKEELHAEIVRLTAAVEEEPVEEPVVN